MAGHYCMKCRHRMSASNRSMFCDACRLKGRLSCAGCILLVLAGVAGLGWAAVELLRLANWYFHS